MELTSEVAALLLIASQNFTVYFLFRGGTGISIFDISFGTENRLGAPRHGSWCLIPGRSMVYSVPQSLKIDVGPHPLPCSLNTDIKQSERKFYQMQPSGGDVQVQWSCTSTAPYTALARRLIRHTGNLRYLYTKCR